MLKKLWLTFFSISFWLFNYLDRNPLIQIKIVESSATSYMLLLTFLLLLVKLTFFRLIVRVFLV